MIRSLLIHRLREGVINSTKLDEFKSDNFDSLLPIYMNLKLEMWEDYTPRGIQSRVSQGNHDTFRDRTGTLPHYLKLVANEPLPEYNSSFNKSFKQICLERAEELVNTGKLLAVTWSGGLDSTTLLLSLLEVVSDPKQIKVLCNYNSIIESGSLFDTHIKPRGVNYDISTSMVQPSYSDGLIICGYPSDQLFGRIHLLQEDEFYINWKDWILPEQVPIIESILENYPGPEVITVPQYLAFIELNTKWDQTKYCKRRSLEPSIGDRIINFYDTVDFQKWSLGRYEDKFKGNDNKTHKLPLKLLLRDLIGSDGYAMNKKKQASHYSIVHQDWVMDLADGRSLYARDF